MLKAFRKKAKLFIWVAAGSFIAFIGLQWGMNITGRTNRSPLEMGVIAEVNGEPISSFEYQNEVTRLARMEAETLEETELSEEKLEDIRDRAFDALVARKLSEQEVRRRKIDVTDEEVLNVIRYSPPREFFEMEDFQTEGEFDFEKYQQFITDRQSLPFLVDYERRIREALPLQKLQLLVISSAKVTPEEVRDEYRRRNEQIEVQYVLLRPDVAEVGEVSDEAIEEYYETHRDELEEPEKALVSYVFFEKKPSEDDEQSVKDRIEEVYEEAVSGASFEELAIYYSEDPGTGPQGGDLDWVSKGSMVKEFEDVVFSLKTGEISKPFMTPFGWHIAKVDGRKGDKVKARHILLRVRPSAETLENMRNEIRLFMEDAHALGFEGAALKHSLESNDTQEFSLNTGYIPGIGSSSELTEFVSDHSAGAVSYPVAKGDRYYILKVVRKTSKRIPPLEGLRDRIRKRVEIEGQKSRAAHTAAQLYEEIVGGSSLQAVAKSHNLTVEKTQPFTKFGTLPKILPQSEFFGAAFALDEGEVSAPVETEQGYFIIEVTKRLAIDEQEFEEVKQTLNAELLQREQQQIYASWIEHLRTVAKIEDYRRRLF